MNVWHGLDDQVERIVARLRPIGREIGEAAQNGDALAARVIANYTMLQRRIDPVAALMTEKALNEWQANRTNKTEPPCAP